MECEEAALMDNLVSYTHAHTCTHTYTALESLPTVAPVKDCAHPTTDLPSHSQQSVSIIPIFIFGLVRVIALVSCLWLYFHHHTIMCKVEVKCLKCALILVH